MNINETKVAQLEASNWLLVIFTPYCGPAQSFYGDREHMLSLCNCARGQRLEYVSTSDYEAQKAEDEEGEWEGEGYYGQYNEAGDYQFINDDADEAIWQILSHDSSNNFSFRGNIREAIANAPRHRLIREALNTEGVIEENTLSKMTFSETMSSCGPIRRAHATVAGKDYLFELNLEKTWLHIIDDAARCESCIIDEDGDVISDAGECVTADWTDRDWQALTDAVGVKLEKA